MADLANWWWLLVAVSLCTVICIISLIVIVFHLCVSNRNETRKCISFLSVFSILAFTLTPISQILIIVQLNDDGQVPTGSYYQMIPQIMGQLCWTFGKLAIYVLFVANLHHTFSKTQHQLSNVSLAAIAVLVVLFTIFRTLDTTIDIMYLTSVITLQQARIPMVFAVVIIQLVDLILSILFVYLFVTKLSKLSQDIIYGNNLLNEKQKAIFYVTRKYIILSTIAIISTQIELLSRTLDDISFLPTSPEFYLISLSSSYILWALDCMITSVCILLNFEFSNKWFDILCCICNLCVNNINLDHDRNNVHVQNDDANLSSMIAK